VKCIEFVFVGSAHLYPHNHLSSPFHCIAVFFTSLHVPVWLLIYYLLSFFIRHMSSIFHHPSSVFHHPSNIMRRLSTKTTTARSVARARNAHRAAPVVGRARLARTAPPPRCALARCQSAGVGGRYDVCVCAFICICAVVYVSHRHDRYSILIGLCCYVIDVVLC
jgi:hypothetical protein